MFRRAFRRLLTYFLVTLLLVLGLTALWVFVTELSLAGYLAALPNALALAAIVIIIVVGSGAMPARPSSPVTLKRDVAARTERYRFDYGVVGGLFFFIYLGLSISFWFLPHPIPALFVASAVVVPVALLMADAVRGEEPTIPS